jgi:hypothetical protein
MRAVTWVVIGLAGGLDGGAVAQAGDAPAIVVPGRRDVPVIINGMDASYCVVEGDFGLARPGQVAPSIIACPVLIRGRDRVGSYFPARGQRPGYGRVEFDDGRKPPPPAPSFHREWSTASDPLPATIDPPAVPLVVAPGWGPRPHRRHR